MILDVPVQNQPQNHNELENRLRQAYINLNPVFIRNTFSGIVTRARKFIAVSGGSFPNE